MKSIKLYLVIAILSAMTLTIFIAVLQGYKTSMVKAEALFDQQMQGVADLLLSVVVKNNSAAVLAPPSLRPISFSESSDEIIYQLWKGDQQTFLVGNILNEPLAEYIEGFSDRNYMGYRWRVFTRYNPSDDLWVMIGERIDQRFLLAENIVLESIIPILLGLPIAALFIWWLIGNGLSLLTRLAEDLTAKQADDLSAIYYKDMPRELSVVVESINTLFKRLENSFKRERNFASDAAHELRTPISALKVHVHNLSFQLPEQSEIINTLTVDLNRLEHLVEQILLLYRTTPENYQANLAVVDLSALVASVVANIYSDIDNKGQSIEIISADKIRVLGDKSFLAIMLRNLISNANKYTPDEGKIIVHLSETDDVINLKVMNDGPGIDESEYDRVFDRFYRIGGDRHSSKVLGCGLGLSIVKHIADLHHAKIILSRSSLDLRAETQEEKMFTFCVKFKKTLLADHL